MFILFKVSISTSIFYSSIFTWSLDELLLTSLYRPSFFLFRLFLLQIACLGNSTSLCFSTKYSTQIHLLFVNITCMAAHCKPVLLLHTTWQWCYYCHWDDYPLGAFIFLSVGHNLVKLCLRLMPHYLLVME